MCIVFIDDDFDMARVKQTSQVKQLKINIY